MRRAAVGVGNRVWGNHTVMEYLKTGVFDYWVPVGHSVHWEVSLSRLQGLVQMRLRPGTGRRL